MTDSFREHFERFSRSQQSRERHISRQELSALMQSIDFEGTMLRLGLDVKPVNSQGEYVGFCPDHIKYKGAPPSDPKWYINSRTGLTYCQTEGRGSNIVEVARYIWDLPTCRDAYKALLNGAALEIRFQPERDETPHEQTLDEKERLKASLDEAMPVLETAALPQECLAYFEKDGIHYDTLVRYGVSYCGYGRLSRRAIVPFLDGEYELCGYVAVDTLGKERWAHERALYRHGIDDSVPLETLEQEYLKHYRKTLYAPGFQGREHIYGLYEDIDFVSSRPETLVIVEGERDCLKLKQEGIPCVAIHGTSLKDEQRIMLKRLGFFTQLKEVFLGFDMDEAGDRACEKVRETLCREMDADRIWVLSFPPDESGNKRDPKRFCRQELLQIMEDSRAHNRRSRQ